MLPISFALTDLLYNDYLIIILLSAEMNVKNVIHTVQCYMIYQLCKQIKLGACLYKSYMYHVYSAPVSRSSNKVLLYLYTLNSFQHSDRKTKYCEPINLSLK